MNYLLLCFQGCCGCWCCGSSLAVILRKPTAVLRALHPEEKPGCWVVCVDFMKRFDSVNQSDLLILL